MLRGLFLALCAITLAGFSACAYHFQGARNTLKDLGIQRIYVTNFGNKTYRPGIEQLFTTAMVREIARAGAFSLVNSENQADAVLSGEVTAADSTPAATTPVKLDATHSADLANQYSSSVSCRVTLKDRRGRVIFTGTASDSRVHPGAPGDQFQGDAASTAPLINDSEQRLAYQFLAPQMMASLYQRMVDTF